MSAEARGYKDGREYMRSSHIGRMTFMEFRQVGTLASERLYVRKAKRREYLMGWWYAGNEFITLFQQDESNEWGAQKRVEYIRVRLGSTVDDFQTLLGYHEDDETLQRMLGDAVELLTRLQDVMDEVAQYVKRPT